MSTPPYTWTAPDGAVISYTPAPVAPSPSPTPAPAPAQFAPSLPAAMVARLNAQPVFDDTFAHAEQWGTLWDETWFGGLKMNGMTLDDSLITMLSGGGISLGVSNAGKTGSMINTNPSNPNKPGFQIGYGYVECDIQFPANSPAWACFWLNGQNWPQNGENDVIEWLSTSGGGHIPTSNYHSGSSPSGTSDVAQNSGQIAGNWNGRHRFGVLRTPDSGGTSYRYWDGALVKQFLTHDGGAPQYVILSIGDPSSGGNGPMVAYRCTAWSLNH